VDNVRAVTQEELVIVELVDRLDVVVADVIARDEVVDQVGVEGISDFLLGTNACIP